MYILYMYIYIHVHFMHVHVYIHVRACTAHALYIVFNCLTHIIVWEGEWGR